MIGCTKEDSDHRSIQLLRIGSVSEKEKGEQRLDAPTLEWNSNRASTRLSGMREFMSSKTSKEKKARIRYVTQSCREQQTLHLVRVSVNRRVLDD